MDAKYLTWNFANLVSVNLMVAIMAALIILAMRLRGGSTANGAAK